MLPTINLSLKFLVDWIISIWEVHTVQINFWALVNRSQENSCFHFLIVSSVAAIVFLFITDTFPTKNKMASMLIMLGLSVYFQKNIFKSHVIKKQILNIYDMKKNEKDKKCLSSFKKIIYVIERRQAIEFNLL